MLGEILYADGQAAHTPVAAIDSLRKAEAIFPLNEVFRKASALRLTEIALFQPDPRWKEAALLELYHALDTDPTSADLLYNMRKFENDLGRKSTHVAMFDRFAEKSKLMRDER